MYIDGRVTDIDTSSAMSTRPDADMPRFVLGTNNKHVKKDADMYKMTLDELRVWDAVMSDEEVMPLYTVDSRLNWDISHWHQDGVINWQHFPSQRSVARRFDMVFDLSGWAYNRCE